MSHVNRTESYEENIENVVADDCDEEDSLQRCCCCSCCSIYHRKQCLNRSLAVIGTLFVIIASFFILYYVLPLLNKKVIVVAQWFNPDSWWPKIVFFFFFAYTVTPIGIGFWFTVLVVALLYGWACFLIVYLGSVAGGILTFTLMRSLKNRGYCSGDCMKRFLYNYRQQIIAVEGTINEHPLSTIVLLQLSFIPYEWLNVLVALMTDVQYFYFSLACFASQFCVIFDVWRGVTAQDFVSSRETTSSAFSIDMIPFAVSLLFSIVSFIFISVLVKKRMKILARREQKLKNEDHSSSTTHSHSTVCVNVDDDQSASSRHSYTRSNSCRQRESISVSPSSC